MPPGWLGRRLRYAERGWDVVLGTVTVADWDGHPPHAPGADHALLAAATEAGCAVLQASDIAVETWARRHARTPAVSATCRAPWPGNARGCPGSRGFSY